MIPLFNIPNHTINTKIFRNFLHDKIVDEFIEEFCSYVGVKHGCAINSATNAIFLSLKDKNTTVEIPTMIPPVVGNAVKLAGCELSFSDNTDWVGDSYTLHDFGDYKIIDSAQKVERNQFPEEANDDDIMIFSFYPTKPVGGMDGGMIVSNDKDKIDYFKYMSLNGMSYSENNWEREQLFIGWKMYLNSAQAYVALRNLRKLDNKRKKLEDIRTRYNFAFNLDNNSNHLYRIYVSNRDEVQKHLKDAGISTGVHYTCLHQSPLLSRVGQPFFSKKPLPKSEILQDKVLTIPYHENLSHNDVETIICQVKQLAKF